MKNAYSLIMLLAIAGAAYSQHCISGRYGELPIFDQSELLIDANVPYAEVTHTFTGQMLTLQLDVWRPDPLVDPVTSRPLVLLIHGGSFLAGNRNEMNSYCEGFARRGYVAATITYRLGWDCDPNAGIFLCGVCGPQQNKLRTAVYNAIQDAHAAARFLYANAEMYGIDPEHFFIGGVSAGSITALGAAMLSQAEANGFAPSAEALSGGLFESGNALPQAHHFKAVLNNCGAVPAVSVLNPEVSVISFHDDGDCVVPYGNGRVLGCLGCNSFPVVAGSQSIHNELVAAGGCSELNTQQISLLHCSWPTGNAIARASCFFKRTLCGVCTGVSNNSSSTSSPCMALGIPCDTTVDDPSQGGCEADLNNDGVVNTADLSAFLSAFGSFCDD